MKRILSYLSLILALVSCEKGTVLHPQEPGEWGGYITFSTGIETKTPINENMRGKDFGVLAYSYTSNWATARPVSTPDLFYNQLVECDNNGICTYDSSVENGIQLKEWDLSKIYSFFAYYPTSSHNYINISASDKTDMPTVTYTFPFASTITVPGNTNLVDLLTASSTDQTGRGSGKVAFNFEHRLFCFEILANNYNDDKPIDIKNLKLTLSGLKHKSITVPMMASDSRTEVVKTSRDDPSSVTFNISDATTTATIPSFKNGGTSFDLSKNCSVTNDGYLMLIPQDGEITGEFTWDMQTEEGITTSITESFTTNLDFQEGKKYSIIINFAGDAITIAIIEAGNWSVNDVETEFE